MGNIVSAIKRMFSLDMRSIALLRVSIGIILLLDLLQRSCSLRAHYSDAGVLPRADLLTLFQNKFFISIHTAGGSTMFELTLFLVAGVFAILLALGYRTKLSAIVSWFLLISLHARNPLVLQGGDVVLRVVLFWMLFLPLEKKWSLDSFLGKVKEKVSNSYFGFAGFAYIVQIFLIYYMSGILKSGVSWHTGGDAVYYALSIEQFTRPLGIWLNQFDSLTTLLTHVTLYIETYAPFLFILPVRTGWLRLVGFTLLAALQIGFNATMSLGLFGTIMVGVTFALLPSEFWDNIVHPLHRWISKKSGVGLSIYFDNECSFCAKSVRSLSKLLFLNETTTIAAAETNKEAAEKMAQMDSWVVITPDGVSHFGYDAFTQILRTSVVFGWLYTIASAPMLMHRGEKWYAAVAKRRLSICLPPRIEKASPTRKEKRGKQIKNTTIGILLVYIVLWNVDTIPGHSVLPQKYEWIGWTMRLDQKFNMFAPVPLTEDGWYVMPGKLADGDTIDIYTGKPLTYQKPTLVSETYKDQRWQKYLMNLWLRDYNAYRSAYGKYLCRQWNSTHSGGAVLQSFDIIFMLEKTGPRHTTFPIEPTTIWSHKCF